MSEGLSKAEILQELKILPKGSFRLKIAEARIQCIGTRPNKKRPHLNENLYPADSVERLRKYLTGGSL